MPLRRRICIRERKRRYGCFGCCPGDPRRGGNLRVECVPSTLTSVRADAQENTAPSDSRADVRRWSEPCGDTVVARFAGSVRRPCHVLRDWPSRAGLPCPRGARSRLAGIRSEITPIRIRICCGCRRRRFWTSSRAAPIQSCRRPDSGRRSCVPLYGYRGPQVHAAARRAGLDPPIMWSKTARDWAPQPMERLIQRLQSVQAGDIVLMHDGSHLALGGDRRHTVQALEHWLPRWKAEGLDLVSLGPETRPGGNPARIDVCTV